MKVIAAIIEWRKEPAQVQVFSTRKIALMNLSEEFGVFDEKPELLTLEQLNEIGAGQFEIRLEEMEVVTQS